MCGFLFCVFGVFVSFICWLRWMFWRMRIFGLKWMTKWINVFVFVWFVMGSAVAIEQGIEDSGGAASSVGDSSGATNSLEVCWNCQFWGVSVDLVCYVLNLWKFDLIGVREFWYFDICDSNDQVWVLWYSDVVWSFIVI